MKLSEETRKKHKWLLKELTAISKELEEMEERYHNDSLRQGRDGVGLDGVG